MKKVNMSGDQRDRATQIYLNPLFRDIGYKNSATPLIHFWCFYFQECLFHLYRNAIVNFIRYLRLSRLKRNLLSHSYENISFLKLQYNLPFITEDKFLVHQALQIADIRPKCVHLNPVKVFFFFA